MRVLLVLLVIFGFSAPPRRSATADRAAVQSTIEQQLQAFLRDDAATAYSFAAPNIKPMFPTRGHLHGDGPAGLSAGLPAAHPRVRRAEGDSPGYLKQTVDIVDAAGEFWTAVYTLRQDADGTWKITGCYLVKKPGECA